MSYTISNFCPASLIHRFNDIPNDISIVDFNITHIKHGEAFPPLPSQIKEVNINENIYTDKGRRLIREDMTKKELKGLLKILFPNTKGVKFFISNNIFGPNPKVIY